jgi:riboflavin kinase/FMN adenylyltransferase
MRVFHLNQALPSECRGAAVAVGNFDGVHLGHRAVIEEAGTLARSTGSPWAVLTFEPHPRSVFAPDNPPLRLSPFSQKVRLIAALGVDILAVIRFDKAFSQISAHDFVETVIHRRLGAGHVVCGHDFAFGRGREGSPEHLLRFGEKFEFGFTCVQEIRGTDGVAYSSTGIREALRAGDPKSAARILGRPFEIIGRVTEGDRRGRTIGFPTANMSLGEYVEPARGVYAVRTAYADASVLTQLPGAWMPGVANLGVRPTFSGTESRLESHLFDFDGDLYGHDLRVQFIEFLRPERKFAGLDDLKIQIAEDSARARDVLADDPPIASTGGL